MAIDAVKPQASGLRPWLLALRPKTLTAAVIPVLVATGLAEALRGQVLWWVTLFAILSALMIQIATNLFNDAIDHEKGADSETRLGPARATQSGWLSGTRVKWVAGAFLVLATVLGLPLVIHGGWPVLTVGLVSLALAYGYTGGPFPLAYRGLGDFFVVIFFGIIPVSMTLALHTGLWPAAGFVAGLQIGGLAAVLIAINNYRDAPEDAKVGKRTLAVRLGDVGAKWQIAALLMLPFCLQFHWLYQGSTGAFVAPWLVLLPALSLLRSLWQVPRGPGLNRLLGQAAAIHFFFGLALMLGLFVSAV
jgi:1,4-dihydroxy-2-naphthoate octaprenyltransferase